MKIFIDTANLAEIEDALKSGVVEGITTNPSLLAKEPKGSYLDHMKRVVALAGPYRASVSVEVFSNEPQEMVRQAKEFWQELAYEPLAIKIPVSHQGKNFFAVIGALTKEKITVNCTACMAPLQAAMAAKVGAKFVSIFYNRLRDGLTEEAFSDIRQKGLAASGIELTDFDPDQVIRETRSLLASESSGALAPAEIIAGSIRTVVDMKRAFLAGAHIVTASAKVIKEAALHFKTDDAVDRFLKDFAAWMS